MILLESMIFASGLYILVISKSPFFIVLSIILTSFSLGVLILTTLNSWMFYSLVVMFLGGMMVAFSYSSSVNMHFKPLIFFKGDFLLLIFLSTLCWKSINNSFTWMSKSLQSYVMYNETMVPALSLMAGMIVLSLAVLMKILPTHEGPLKMVN